MKFPSRETVERVRREYPAGTRVELVRMDDVQAPPIGTKGTVTGVDDTASVMVAWDNGSSLHVVYGEDACRKLETVRTICYGKRKYGTAGRRPRTFSSERLQGATAASAPVTPKFIRNC